MDYNSCLDEIKLAKEAVMECKLSVIAAEMEAVCDAYCIPSHNHQTFYIELFCGVKEWMLLYAKPVLHTVFGAHIAMYTFAAAVKARCRNGIYYKREIVCGIKCLPFADPTVNTLLQCLPKEKTIVDEEGLRLDGTTTLIRNLQGTVIPFFYYDKPKYSTNAVWKEHSYFLENFYLEIEQIIGNTATEYTK